ncbi:peroxiredoxin Q/BCP [Sphingomonas gellani]|uniref:thioredoxin-dependent peroxiredoxin n=1 Tax=Sphingomonas gellani TaxID=1166340 RepID=A0A1H8FM34_9SPHN|nr:peroxiredoxin [Sphingomonas gellani]SEN32759.1 peroxiredoxin Q/BCP [Sphingomonas gellani]
MNEGDTMPAIAMVLADRTRMALSDLPLPAVIYFYPKDDTSGCTREAQDFSALAEAFAAAGASVTGISRDSAASHVRFSEKHGLSIRLGSDEDGAVTEAFGVWGEKTLYGRKYMGVERATFLFGVDGRAVRIWRKVRVAGHAEAVLEAVRALQTAP